MSKGDLNSRKARLELKAVKRTCEMLSVDRPTSVSENITEQTAANTALQKAAMEVAQRVIPRLVQ